MKNKEPVKCAIVDLGEKIYKEQFWEYHYEDGCDKANEVLKEIRSIDKNPLLLDYTFKCLEELGFEQPTLYYIMVHQGTRGSVYKGDAGNKTYDTVIKRIFYSEDEARTYAETPGHDDVPERLLFEMYTIETINGKE